MVRLSAPNDNLNREKENHSDGEINAAMPFTFLNNFMLGLGLISTISAQPILYIIFFVNRIRLPFLISFPFVNNFYCIWFLKQILESLMDISF